MTDRPLILVVEDDPPIVELLRYNLEGNGFGVAVASDGDEALSVLEEMAPDLVLLDWMLPGVTGIEVCRRIRSRTGTRELPVVMLTARGEEHDRIRGLDTGADDYIVKPFSPAELAARLRALLRRMRPGLAGETLSYRDIEVDTARHRVTRAGRPVRLGPKEYQLLCTFIERPTRVLSRGQLLDAVWGRTVYVEERTVDVHIRRLRKALNAEGDPDAIRTVRGGGYALDLDG